MTASLSYRLSGDSPFPGAVEDCKCAIRFLRANAPKYGIDPDRIGVAGSSEAGAMAFRNVSPMTPHIWRSQRQHRRCAGAHTLIADELCTCGNWHITQYALKKAFRPNG